MNNKGYYSLLVKFNEFTLIPNGPMMKFWQSYLDFVLCKQHVKETGNYI